MSNLVHDSMKKVRDTQSSKNISKPEILVVDDPTQSQPTIDDRLEQFEAPGTAPAPEQIQPSTGTEYKFPEKQKISEMLEKLIFIGRISKEIEIFGIVFEVASLTNKEHNEIVQMMYGFKDPADLFTIRVLTLANALRKIDGILLNEIDIEGTFESQFHKKISIIDNLQLSVVEKLYDVYEKLVEEEEKTSNKNEEIKNS